MMAVKINEGAAMAKDIAGNSASISREVSLLALDRRQRLQDLYKAFQRQLLDGCGNLQCSTPTCATFRRRKAHAPFRPFTVLTARAIAAELVSCERPSKKLCPWLNMEVKSVARAPSSRTSTGVLNHKASGPAGSTSSARIDGVSPTPSGSTSSDARPQDLPQYGTNSSSDRYSCNQTSVKSERQTPGTIKRDPKSFTQRLFTTTAMRNLETANVVSLQCSPCRTQSHGVGNSDLHQRYIKVYGEISDDHSMLLVAFGRNAYIDQALAAASSFSSSGKNLSGNWRPNISSDMTRLLNRISATINHEASRKEHFDDISSQMQRDIGSAHSSASWLDDMFAHIFKWLSQSSNTKPRSAAMAELTLNAGRHTPPVDCQSHCILDDRITALSVCLGALLLYMGCGDVSIIRCLPVYHEVEALLSLAQIFVIQVQFERTRDRFMSSLVLEKTRQLAYFAAKYGFDIAWLGVDVDTITKRRSVQANDQIPKGLLMVPALFLQVIRQELDPENLVIDQVSVLGGALQILKTLSSVQKALGFTAEDFIDPVTFRKIDPYLAPQQFMQMQHTEDHILGYPFLFTQSALLTFFRSINYRSMSEARDKATRSEELLRRLSFSQQRLHEKTTKLMGNALHRLNNRCLVLYISRKSLLKDTFDQLWRRHPFELLRPLKIVMDSGSGEVGSDHGGVQQEFLRLAVAEAFDPKYGMFATDEQINISWFQPKSLEPLWKFQMLGLIASLATYNGLHLPFSFPRALYMKLLGQEPTSLEDIQDGWPELAQGLMILRDWPDADVKDIFTREFVYNIEVFGKVEQLAASIDPTTNKPHTVTNDNRHQFIQFYIKQLVSESVKAKYEAFERGFFTCLAPRALSLFTPDTLRELVEGKHDIDWRDLEQAATYDGFNIFEPLIRDFWELLRRWGEDQGDEGRQKLSLFVEFVTASPRLPIGGARRMLFVIQANGTGDEKWPTSHTCFGRLLLPKYKSAEILQERLENVLEYSQGFGQA